MVLGKARSVFYLYHFSGVSRQGTLEHADELGEPGCHKPCIDLLPPGCLGTKGKIDLFYRMR